VDEVATGIDVVLTGAAGSRTLKTNGFGDFEFEGLEDAANFTVRIEALGYVAATLTTKTSRDIYLGEIVLRK
jgi:hypothetical protein